MAESRMGDVDRVANSDATAAQIQALASSGFALAVQMLRNQEDAADAVQDSVYTLLRKRRMFDPRRGELRAWFLKIVRNRCLDALRKRARQNFEPVELSEVSDSTVQRPDLVAEKQEILQLLKQELMTMPQDQREILLLRDYHDLSYTEMAGVLSIPVGTVMSRLHRARIELRRRMQAQW